MIFDEIFDLSDVLGASKSSHQFRDEHDPEVDKLYNGSPPMQVGTTFEMESAFKTDDNVATKDPSQNAQEEPKPLECAVDFLPSKIPAESFRRVAVPDRAAVKSKTSILSNLLAVTKSTKAVADTSHTIQLTIYLPNLTSIDVNVNDSDNFEVVIKKVLKFHKESRRRPELSYHAPEKYELRMHEGDGEPDRDFPALDRSKNLKEFNLNEFCLCEAEGPIKPSSAGASANDLKESDLDSDSVMVSVASAGAVVLKFTPETSLRDLLPAIASYLAQRGSKLRLYTDEFSFVVPADEQAKLKLISPIIRPDTKISSLGFRKFELQRRVFADSTKTQRPAMKQVQQRQDPVYTEALAAMYQEWVIVKKNKFGRKQDRVFGIDGKMVYNRGSKANSSVSRPQRELASIRKVERVNDRTFKISWEEENGELQDIEYQCDNTKDCKEIIAKLGFLMARR